MCYNVSTLFPRQARDAPARKERETVTRPRTSTPRFAQRVRSRSALFFALTTLPGVSAAQSRFVPLSAISSASRFALPSPLIRVGLMAASLSRQIVFAATGGARLFGPDGGEKAAGLGPWNFTRSGGAYLISDAQNHTLGVLRNGESWRLQCDAAEGLLCLRAANGGVKRYRGALEIGMAGGRLQIVNEVALESYLCGVVSREMGRAPAEALKAQAVAARTYAVFHSGQWTANGYDVRDTTDSQVYGGFDGEKADGNAAVLATNGLILMANSRPIAAQFCADCGGASLPETGADYVHDADAHGPADHSAPPGWSLVLPASRLLALLQPKLKFALSAFNASPKSKIQNPKSNVPDENDTLDPTAAYDSAAPIEPIPVVKAPPVPLLDAVQILNSDAGGRVRKLRYVWNTPSEKGKGKVKGKPKSETHGGEISGNALRTLLGLNVLRSTLFTVKKDADGNFVFTGRGWGHGHGLCQTGAMALASEPFHYDFRAILARYYPDAEPGRLTYLEPEDSSGDERTTALPTTPDLANEETNETALRRGGKIGRN